MIAWLRKLLHRDVTITVAPVLVPPGHGVVFITRGYVPPEHIERMRAMLTEAGFPETVLVCGMDDAYTIDIKEGA